MLLHYGVVQILQAVAPDFLNIMCHVSKNHFMNNFGLSNIQVQWNQDMSDKRMPGETQELWGEVRGWNTMRGAAWWQAWKSLDKYFCQGKHFTVHYTVKRKVCAGLKPIWLVQVWRQRDLESIVLDLRVRTYPSISAFTQKDWNPPTLFFQYHIFRPLSLIHTDWSIILHCAMSLLCGHRWY